MATAASIYKSNDTRKHILKNYANSIQNEFPGLSKARIKYMRFRCKDPLQTIEFYQTMGMALDTTVKLPDGTTILTFMYKGPYIDFNDNSLQLRFEHNPNEPEIQRRTHGPSIAEKSSTTAAVLRTMLTTIRKTKEQKKIIPAAPARKKIDRNSEHLVVYSFYVPKRVDKLRKRGFKVKLDPVDNLGMKFAIVEDPNGIEIWIVDATNEMVNETDSNGRLWGAKLGHYSIPVARADPIVRYYEELFSTRAKQRNTKPAATSENDSPDLKTMSLDKLRTLKGLSAFLSNAHKQKEERVGFHLIDRENIPIGLTNNKYFWMSNQAREKVSGSICFVETIDGGTHEIAKPNFERPPSPFLGLGFEVPVLETATKTLAKHYVTKLTYTLENHFIRDLGYHTRFTDTHDGGWSVDIYSKTGYEYRRKNKNSPITSGPEYILDPNYLKGRSRVFSVGAILVLNHDEEGWEEAVRKVKKRKRAFSLPNMWGKK